ncbi:tartrate-resistant acid phosphatase type 5-like [Mya arenaria]|uniref:tartrate-resistant acid phosphatase type 5-like n=1 Tax=Mya arenaria TaxID=6604 RepID=UPI0022E2840C|nr:tartrate-resistant acid phosphatase type 5-like [Mya arenaria]
MVDRLVIILFLLHGASCLDSLRFLAVGDWGGLPTFPYETPVELAVAKQMADVTNTYHTSFNLALGDNFYFDGVKDVDDKRFKETFEHVFHYESLMNPWYLVAGNHDHNGNVSAQIAYSNRSERWNFPDYYYALSFKIPGGGVVDIVMIDTVLLCGNTDDDVVGDQPHGPSNAKVSDDQWSWIDLQLQSSKADFLLVAGHFPVYSIAEHGPTDCLIDRLKPMLYKYGVTAYLSGHDHNLQHINSQENGKTVDYFVTGAGNFVDASEAHKSDIPSGTLKYHWAEIKELGGFSYLEVTPNNMTMTFVNGRRTPLYTYTLFPRK